MKKLFAALGAAAVLGTMAGPAAAHVTVQPVEAPVGSFFKFAVRVPSERPEPTTKVVVHFPENLVFVSFKPKDGWTRTVKMKKLEDPIEAFGAEIDEVVDTVTWSGGEIGAGEFDEFEFSAKVPDEAGELEFAADQTYASGEIVKWNEGEEDEHPAAIVHLVQLPEGDHHGAGELGLLVSTHEAVEEVEQGLADANAHMGDMMASGDEGPAAEEDSDTVLLLLAVAGIALGGIALAVTLARGKNAEA